MTGPETCHMYIAIDRKKDHPDNNGKSVIRQIIKDPEIDLRIIEEKYRALYPAKTFRIYHTVNCRSFSKALRLFKHELIDKDDKFYYRLDSLWRSCLLNPEAKAENKLLIDIDTNNCSIINEIINEISVCTGARINDRAEIFKEVKTPNGFHLVTSRFDYRDIADTYPEVEVKKDAYYFVKKVSPGKGGDSE
jgi:hypothetical protein